jgi:hypothetical protein
MRAQVHLIISPARRGYSATSAWQAELWHHMTNKFSVRRDGSYVYMRVKQQRAVTNSLLLTREEEEKSVSQAIANQSSV